MIEGPLEKIEDYGSYAYYRYKFKYDSNGNVVDMNGNRPDENTFNAKITISARY